MSVAVHPSWSSGAVQFHTLYKLLAELSRATALEDVYEAALTSLLEATAADRAAILLFDDDGVIRFKASRNLSVEYQTAVTGHSPWRQGTRNAEPILVSDVLADDGLADFKEHFVREGIRALAMVPLARDAGVFGKFMLYYSRPHQHTADEVEIATIISAHVALATEHKRSELARTRLERLLQSVVDNSPTVVFVKDLQGLYLLVNRRWEDLLHLKREDAIGKTDYEIFPKEIADQFTANDRAVLAAGKPLALEEDAPHDEGIHNYISIKFPLDEGDGNVAGLCGIATDITERKQLEIASQRLAAIVESSDDAIISKDLNGIITSWNSGAERMFGYTASEAIGQPVSILATPERVDEMPRILAQIQQGIRVGHFETQRRSKEGRILDVSLTVSPVRDRSGRITGASKIARDITDLKRAELERIALLEREREAHRTTELLNQVAPRFAAQLDLQKLVQEVTDIATALVGAEFGAFFHNTINESGESYRLYALSGAPREAFAAFPMPSSTHLFGPTIRGEAIVRCDDVTQDVRYGKNPPHDGMPKGHLPVRSYLAAPVVSRSGEVLGSLFFGHSLTVRFTPRHEAILAGIAAQAAISMDNARLFEQAQWTQAELKRSNEELRRANRDLEVFAYSASHDLQEPLRTIAISAQFIQQNNQLTGDDAGLLGDILMASKRMHSLVEDLLTYTKATKYEEGPPPLVESSEVLSGVLKSLRASIEEAGALVISGELPPVAIHANRLAQLFQNLLSNAIKYRGSVPPRIRIAAEERDGWTVFSVSDNGIGIKPKYAEQIFVLFKRLHGRDQYPGSGMGLAICQRVVEQYGGRIWLEKSAIDEGSTFAFLFRRQTDETLAIWSIDYLRDAAGGDGYSIPR